MAYRKSRRSGARRSRRSYGSRRSGRSARRMSSGRGARHTVRIELVQGQPNMIARPQINTRADVAVPAKPRAF